MSEYIGMYEKRAKKLIAEQEPQIEINWINMAEKEALAGGADKVTNLLRKADYKPDASGVVEEKREAYINGTEKIRLPQEIWALN